MKTLLSLIALALLPLSATAQEVWRCGPDGRVFSDKPCAQGKQLETPQPRPEADVQAAQAQAVRDAQRAEVMRRERLALEARQRGNGLSAIGPQAAAVKPAKAAQKKRPQKLRKGHPEDDGTWRATAPASRRTKG